MRPHLPLLTVLALTSCSAQEPADSIPFEPLGPPDTVLTATALADLERRHALAFLSERRITWPEETGDDTGARLVRPYGKGWLVYALPVYQGPQGSFRIQGFTEDGRFLRLTQWSGNIGRGFEVSTVDLYLVDVERAQYAMINIRTFEQQWDQDGQGTDMKGRTTIDSTVVTIAGDLVYYTCECTENGRSVPCADGGGAYRITPDALVRDRSISIALPTPRSTGPPAPLTTADLLGMADMRRLCPRYFGPTHGLTVLDTASRSRLLQDHAPRYADALLSYGRILSDRPSACITLFCDRDDDHDLLWLLYDESGRLIGLDTLASQWGDGQLIRWECAYLDSNGELMVETVEEETLRDEVDTIAYRRDTLLFRVERTVISGVDASGAQWSQQRLKRVPADLTGCWVEKHAVNERPPHTWHALREVIPAGRRVLQQADGDLNKDGAQDHVFVLTNAADDGPRDLLIAFTAPDRGRFIRHTLLHGFLPDRTSGGFHDPIGEPGISGIAIREDTLLITQFGGSAWKWISTDAYVHDPERDSFFLVLSGGRNFHAAGEEQQREELAELEALRAGRDLSPEQAVRYAELNKLVEQATWKSTRFAIGERPMAR